MKIGNLVELSAYGKRLKCNIKALGRVGLVITTDVREVTNPSDAIVVSWSGLEQKLFHIRRDLKHAK